MVNKFDSAANIDKTVPALSPETTSPGGRTSSAHGHLASITERPKNQELASNVAVVSQQMPQTDQMPSSNPHRAPGKMEHDVTNSLSEEPRARAISISGVEQRVLTPTLKEIMDETEPDLGLTDDQIKQRAAEIMHEMDVEDIKDIMAEEDDNIGVGLDVGTAEDIMEEMDLEGAPDSLKEAIAETKAAKAAPEPTIQGEIGDLEKTQAPLRKAQAPLRQEISALREKETAAKEKMDGLESQYKTALARKDAIQAESSGEIERFSTIQDENIITIDDEIQHDEVLSGLNWESAQLEATIKDLDAQMANADKELASIQSQITEKTEQLQQIK